MEFHEKMKVVASGSGIYLFMPYSFYFLGFVSILKITLRLHFNFNAYKVSGLQLCVEYLKGLSRRKNFWLFYRNQSSQVIQYIQFVIKILSWSWWHYGLISREDRAGRASTRAGLTIVFIIVSVFTIWWTYSQTTGLSWDFPGQGGNRVVLTQRQVFLSLFHLL